jgi:hypothetical protein
MPETAWGSENTMNHPCKIPVLRGNGWLWRAGRNPKQIQISNAPMIKTKPNE